MYKVLITGGAGFIGSHTAIALSNKGYDVTVFDNLSPQIHGPVPEITSPLYSSLEGKVTFIRGDITDREALSDALRGQEVVVHLAAETGTGQSMYQIERYTQVNVGGTALLLDLLANNKTGVKKLIVASSRAIYGEGKYFSDELGIVYPGRRTVADMSEGNFEVTYPGCSSPLILMATDELSKIHPASVYGITKQNQEQMVMLVTDTIGIAGVALRFQNVYGPGQSLSNPYTGILSIFSTQIINGSDINVFEDGEESRDFVYIDDVVRATIMSIENENANGRIFNVGSGCATSVHTVAKLLMQELEGESRITISGNFRRGDIRHNYADITRIRETLGFSSNVDFNTGIRQFAQWVKKQERTADTYANSIDELKVRGLIK